MCLRFAFVYSKMRSALLLSVAVLQNPFLHSNILYVCDGGGGGSVETLFAIHVHSCMCLGSEPAEKLTQPQDRNIEGEGPHTDK
jgi:hypothetical protein